MCSSRRYKATRQDNSEICKNGGGVSMEILRIKKAPSHMLEAFEDIQMINFTLFQLQVSVLDSLDVLLRSMV